MSLSAVLFYLLAITPQSVWSSDASSLLWFPSPAWDYYSALPIGNGRLGGMIYGYPDREIISLNEDSIWSGRWTNRINANAKSSLQRIRDKLDQGSITEAGQDWLRSMSGNPTASRSYQPAGDLIIETGHPSQGYTAYNRTLDLTSGVASTKYTWQGVTYERQHIANNPSNVLAFRQNVASVAASGSQITLKGFAKDDSGLTFTSKARIVNNGGAVSSAGSTVTVTGANEVYIYWDAETLFRYPNGAASYESVLDSRLTAAVQKTFPNLLTEAINDYASLYNRVSLNLGESGPAGKVSTVDRLIAMANNNDINNDPELLTLLYNFGRYCFVASARPGSLPPNLQGIWNDNFNPPWGSKYTVNINLQMNYWLADQIDIPESYGPLWDLSKAIQTRGRQCASDMYNARGWVMHHNTDLWGDCVPHDNDTMWSIFPLAGAWLMSHATEHYRYTQDKAFARDIALPLISDSMAFFYDFAVVQGGYRAPYPCASPENIYVIPSGKSNAGQTTGIDKATQMDRALLWDLFTGFIELSRAVGSTNGVSQAQQFLSQIQPPTVSQQTGRLLEWSGDFAEGEPDHRHFSPLFGLHPGVQYSPLRNSTIATAAANLLNHRMDVGSGSTGWSRIWASALYARLFEGDKSLSSMVYLITHFTYSNLLSKTSGVFQIDANFGTVAALHEMFLQSNNGMIHIGPALPINKISKGSFRGWIARGNFAVDASWDGNHITGATVKSRSGGPLTLRIENGRAFKVNGQTYTSSIQTTSGVTYTVTF